MTTLINSLTGGAAGTQITNANSAGGGNAFNETDTPQDTAGGSILYGTSHGLPAIHTTTGATSGPQRRGWIVNLDNVANTQYAVFYFDRSDVTGVNYFPFRAMDAISSSQRVMIHATSGGLIHLRNSLNSNVWSSTTLTSGTRYRVEVMWGGTTSSNCQVKIFVEEGTTTVQDSGIIANVNCGGTTQSVWWGQTSSATNNSGKISGRVGWSDTTWVGPAGAAPIEPALDVHLGIGIPSSSGVTVSQQWSNALDVPLRLAVSTASDLSNPSFGPSATVDSKNWVKLSITGLSPNTQYYAGVEVDGTVSDQGQFSFKTAPFPGDGVSHSIAFGSCRWDNGGEESFAAIKSMHDASTALHGKFAFIADMGDNGYPDWGQGGATVTEDLVLALYASQAKWSGIPQTLKVVPWAYIFDNHDSGGDPSDKNGSWRTPVLAAYKRAVPHRTISASSGAVYQYWDWGRVRYIMPDNRSERDDYTITDNASKRMWSQEQEDWFIDRVEEWPWAVCVLGSIYARQDTANSQRWGSYATQWNRINDRLNSADSLRRLVWLNGDRHALCADLGVSANTRGIPQACGAPFEQGSVDLPANEPWDVGGGTAYYNPTPNLNMRAFGEASFTDTGGDSIVFTYYGRTSDGVTRVQMTKTLDVSPRVLWTNKASRI